MKVKHIIPTICGATKKIGKEEKLEEKLEEKEQGQKKGRDQSQEKDGLQKKENKLILYNIRL